MSTSIFKRFVCILLPAVIIAVACPLTVLAANNDTASKLFLEELSESEMTMYDRMLNDESNIDDNGKYKKTEFIIERKATASIRVTDTQIVSDMLKIVIPKGKTLTIDKGATLKVYGELVIEGTLDNKGTIIIGLSDLSAETDGVVVAYLTNSNSTVNSGTMKIYFGTLDNRPGAKLENKGTMSIYTKEPTMVGIRNTAITNKGVTTVGTVINSGTINVENTQGTGLRNFANAIFENNGKIYKTKRGTVKGTITGEAVINK